jgi:hypothetical protein
MRTWSHKALKFWPGAALNTGANSCGSSRSFVTKMVWRLFLLAMMDAAAESDSCTTLMVTD